MVPNELDHFLRPPAEPIPVLVTIHPFPDDENILLAEIVPADKTLQMTRERHMNELSENTRRLLRNLAHEIKNPLGGIRGAAQLLEGELHDPENKEFTEVIISEADRLQHEGRGHHDHNAQEQLALEEVGDALCKSAEGEIRIALVLLDDLDDVDDDADLKQNDDRLWPDVRLKRVGVPRHTRRNRRFKHMREEREAKEDEEQNVDNQFKHSAATPL